MDFNSALKLFSFKVFRNDLESASKLKKKYRALAKKHHPDVGGSEDKFKELNEAYSLLLNFFSKKEYEEPKNKKSKVEQTFTDFRDFLISHEHFIISVKWLKQQLSSISSKVLSDWLTIAKDLHYIVEADYYDSDAIGIEYIPPQITINRFYFMHAIKMANGYRGNLEYHAAEEIYKKHGWNK